MLQMQNPSDRHSYRFFLVLLLLVLASLAYLSSRFSSQATLAQTSKSVHPNQTVVATSMQGAMGSALPGSSQVSRASAKEIYGRLPLSFIANRGQTDSQVQFLARGSGYNLFLTPNEAVLTLHKREGGGQAEAAIRRASFPKS